MCKLQKKNFNSKGKNREKMKSLNILNFSSLTAIKKGFKSFYFINFKVVSMKAKQEEKKKKLSILKMN